VKIEFNRAEVELILEWIEKSLNRSNRFGGSQILFPEDAIILNKLRQDNGIYELSTGEIRYLADTMETAVHNQYGSAIYLFGLEKILYEKIVFLNNSIENSG
jgi:hypothetical protein